MSANNTIYIDQTTNKAYYQGCVDNGLKGMKLIAKGKNLEEVINKAQKWLLDNEIYLEYGFNFWKGAVRK